MPTPAARPSPPHYAFPPAGLALERDDTLVRMPRGFESAPASVGDALRLKSWVVRRPLADAHDPALPDHLAGFATTATPMLRFGWAALDRPLTTD